MKIRICENSERMSRAAADLLGDALRACPSLLMGLATGATPTRTYELLADDAREDAELVRHVRLVAIDEWGGLAAGDSTSCDSYARRMVVEPLQVDETRYTHFVSTPEDREQEAWRVRQWLAERGPIDICILGLGANGHLALVEPASELVRGAHVAALSDASLAHNMLTDARPAPTFGLTLGIDDLLSSRQILLLVSGARKRPQLRRLLGGPISTEFPASLLWLHHNTTLLCDRASADTVAPGGTAR